jgi:RND family efflux transporter MFP subunit
MSPIPSPLFRAPRRHRARKFVVAVWCVGVCCGGATVALVARRVAARTSAQATAPTTAGRTSEASPPRPSEVSPPRATEAVGPAPTQGWVGVVMPEETADLAAREPGRVDVVLVRVGDRVSRGQLLAKLDARVLDDALRVSVATSAAGDAEAERRRADAAAATERLARAQALAREGLVSGDDLARARQEEMSTRLLAKTARAERFAHGARAESARHAAELMDLRAPFDGIVAARFADTGASVATGTRIVRVVRTGAPIVRFAIPQGEGAFVGIGTRVAFGAGRLALTTKIAPEVDMATRTLTAEATIEGPLGNLHLGDLVRVGGAP